MDAWWTDSWTCLLPTTAVGGHLLESARCRPGGGAFQSLRLACLPSCFPQDPGERICSLPAPFRASELVCPLDAPFPRISPLGPPGLWVALDVVSTAQPVPSALSREAEGRPG